MLTVARIHLLTALLFVAGLLDAGASIPKNRVGDFFDRAPVLTAPESLQVAELHLENRSLYDWNASGSTLWTHFDPEGLASLDDTRKDGKVTIAESQDLQFTNKEATSVLKQYNAPVVTPKDVSDKTPQGFMQDINPVSQINDLRREFPGKTDSEVFAASSAKSNAARARYELVKNEGSPRDAQNIQLSMAMGELTFQAATIPFMGIRASAGLFEGAIGRMSTAGIVDEARAIVKSPQMAKLQNAFEAGDSLSIRIGGRSIQGVPNGPFSGFTNFRGNGFALGKDAFSSQGELQRTVLHELYRLNRSSTRGGAIWGQAATQETKAAAAFAERFGN